jgi:predicted dehydrogenase
MGNQIHNHPSGNYRRVVEKIRAGQIGPVERVHIWMQTVDHFVAGKRATENKVPPGISYDLWLGPAPFRPFDVSHFHFNWRYWWDFGGGQLADFACHYIDLPYWALELGYPATVEAIGEKAHDGDNDVPKKMRVDYHFPERNGKPPVHLTWYQGGYLPEGAEAYGKNNAVLFEGRDGRLIADYTTHKIFLAAGTEKELLEPAIPDSPGQQQEWLQCVRNGTAASCNFEYGGVLTEIGLLGNVSYRAGKKKLEWDAANMRAPNCPESDQFLRREYREGWKL